MLRFLTQLATPVRKNNRLLLAEGIYVEEALRGHAILNVYAPTSEQVERVKDILVDHHARTMKYFGRWAITVLHH